MADESVLLVPESVSGAAPSSSGSETVLRTVGDYKLIKEIGEGSYSTVYLAEEKEGRMRRVAVKMCLKRQIIKDKKIAQIQRERQILAQLSTKENKHSFIISLHATFQDPENLFFVSTLAENGDLLHAMLRQPEKRFSLSAARFYSAELLDALIHLHSFRIVHRDVKPENCLLAGSGHLLLSDFGCARVLEDEATAPEPPPPVESSDSDDDQPRRRRIQRRCSFVGTAQYVCPEILEGRPVSTAVDYWSFGVVVYQLITGKHCFHDESEYLMYKRIQGLLYKFPEDFPAPAKDLVKALLVKEVEKRLGSPEMGGADAVRNHAFFEEIEWKSLEEHTPPQLV